MSRKHTISNSQLKLARLVKEFLEGDPEVMLECTWDWLVTKNGNPMYVDIYVPKYKLAIEYQGQQHYFFPNRYHKTYDEFRKQQIRDKEKRRLLIDKGISYISWRYDEDINAVTLAKKLKRFNIPMKELPKEVADEIKKRSRIPYKRTRKKRPRYKK